MLALNPVTLGGLIVEGAVAVLGGAPLGLLVPWHPNAAKGDEPDGHQ